MTGVALNTVTKLLVDLGTVCSIHQDRVMRGLPWKRLQVDYGLALLGGEPIHTDHYA